MKISTRLLTLFSFFVLFSLAVGKGEFESISLSGQAHDIQQESESKDNSKDADVKGAFPKQDNEPFLDRDGDEIYKKKISENSFNQVAKEEKARSANKYRKPGDFVHGFVATLFVIIVSELGDKTFFIAAIMAMKHNRTTVFVGAMSALAMMHVMSTFFGYTITVIPRVYTYYLSSFLFAIFGIKMFKEGWKMSPNEAQEEFEEVQKEFRKREDVEARLVSPGALKNLSLWSFVSQIFIQAFTMTFLAEWGDRSQLAAIVLAAREEIKSVVIGGILGHAVCTGLAVIGGRFIAQRISVRTVTLIGGVVFITFAMTALFIDPEKV